MSTEINLLSKIASRQAHIAVVGLGYVGLPLLLRFFEVGFKVTGLDIDRNRISHLLEGRSPIMTVPAERTASLLQQIDRVVLTSSFSDLRTCDAVIICVPTPLSNHLEPDISAITSVLEQLTPYMHPGMVISLESTTYPGTTMEEIVPRVCAVGLTVGDDVFVLFSPEREDPGNRMYSTPTIPKVVGGVSPSCLEIGKALYGSVVDRVVPVSSPGAAELTKLLENIFRAVNIGLINELKIVSDRLGIDLWEVIEAASTKPFGFTPFYPGPGLGGHCIPVDPFYLTWKAKEFGLHTRFIELAGEINRTMPSWVVDKVVEALNLRKMPVNGSRVLVLGVAYKKNIEDIRESPAIEIIRILRSRHAVVTLSDPHVAFLPEDDHIPRPYWGESTQPLSVSLIKAHDIVVLVTDHDAFDYEMILSESSIVVDTRGRFRSPHPNLVRA